MRKLIILAIFFSAIAFGQQIQKGVEEVSPTEDLMREHGVLDRLMLIYQEVLKRMAIDRPLPPHVLKKAASLTRRFIEDYHEKLEEEYIFPRFEKAGMMLDLVHTLKEQHQQGRVLTNYILQHASEPDAQLKETLKEYINMYRPHTAREDTVLFPAFKRLISQKEYDLLGDLFEAREKQLFGEDGFNKIVEEVAQLEKELGIYTLSNFTPVPKTDQ